MAVAVEVDQEAAAVETIVRAALRAIAQAGDQDALAPEAQASVEAVLLNLVADAAQPIPSGQRIAVLAQARELIASFLTAVIAEQP